jgi:hypothetical protein
MFSTTVTQKCEKKPCPEATGATVDLPAAEREPGRTLGGECAASFTLGDTLRPQTRKSPAPKGNRAFSLTS